MKRKMISILSLLLSVLFLASCGSAPTYDDSDLQPATDFAVTGRDEKEHRLSDFYGKPIIVNFWATWCEPCQAELPYLDAAYGAYGDQIQFMMVDLVDGYYETEDGTAQFVDSCGYRFPLFFDTDQEGTYAYGVTSIPYTLAINANGRIVAMHLGSMSESDVQELVEMLLNG